MIEIKITGQTATEALHELALLGQTFFRSTAGGVQHVPLSAVVRGGDPVTDGVPVTADGGPVTPPAEAQTPDPAPEPERKPRKGGRRYGQSDADKARRTKEQMAVDKELEELANALGKSDADLNADEPAADILLRWREESNTATREALPNIRANPEDRQDPAVADTGRVYTRDDVRTALGNYANKFGMPAAQQNGPALLGAKKISEIPDDAEAFKRAVLAIEEAIANG